ncbi:cupin domain-containing protein [Metasolibacillus fluoroglycofenilyticus]|uniref:cupin domain-containing protein n=1 Tax=Metasolibacillus fluoroglycofenilyticus TaxID=1239396 RepID=UPI000D35895B|nr:cupin domain-containing protein [Metasolibacillus fluoroglycofenilyticus]
MTQSAQFYIEQLQLEAHPEGGYYKSSFRANEEIATRDVLRPIYTSIYFLLRSQDISHLHRLQSDELWYYHAGSPLTVHMIYPDGTYEAKKLGLNIAEGETPQILVPKHTIFGSSVDEAATFSLVGCMVAPGFDFADFELFTLDELLANYPQHEAVIRKMAYVSKGNTNSSI